MIKGTIINGEFSRILIREKYNQKIEIGELLVCEDNKDNNDKDNNNKNNNAEGYNNAKSRMLLLQAYDIIYGSQISPSNLELISGMKLEQNVQLEFMEPELRNYNIIAAKHVVELKDGKANLSKSLPAFFSDVREINKADLSFLTMPTNPLLLGRLRSGSRIIDADIFLEGDKVLPEHILITSSTGKGKSNLTSCMLWSLIDKEYCGMLVIDPHDEYFGRKGYGMKDHPLKETVAYYTPNNVPAGGRTLKINIKKIRPCHFNGAANWSEAQREALAAYHKKYKEDWIKAILMEEEVKGFQESTIAVIKRRMLNLLNLNISAADGSIVCNGIFDFDAGKNTLTDICNQLEKSNTVIIDTSSFGGNVEILIGSLVLTEVFNRYKRYKREGILEKKPIISAVLEEAPRVLGKEVLEKGSNIFSTIAREGRKFKVGLIAITQLPSLIPRTILANMNTKIIMGIELNVERQAIIESASQDLSMDSRNIASLDKGEAIVTSSFVRFAMPVKVPLFSDLAKETQNKFNKEKYIKNFEGINMQ